jgi:hypothetical protein
MNKAVCISFSLLLASAAHAFPTTQETINCAKNNIGNELIATDIQIINQSLDLIKDSNCPAQDMKCFKVKFEAERRGKLFEGSVRLQIGANLDAEKSYCKWTKKGFFGALSDFNIEAIN